MRVKKDKFWLAELGVRLGPLILGTEYSQILPILHEHGIDIDLSRMATPGKLSIPEIGTELIFSQTNHRPLERIEVEDERLRFGSLSVIGRRAHEIVRLFKVSRKETLWCSNETNMENLIPATLQDRTAQSRKLLASGTLWITSLGLGLTLRDGLIAKVHLCDPIHSPNIGNGSWTKEQQLLSEVREMPAEAITTTQNKRISVLSSLTHLSLVVSIGLLMWWGIALQRRWNEAPDVPAVVVAMEPAVLPNIITLSFNDSKGVERRQSLGHRQFYMSPNIGDEVNIRYLPEAPEMVLGPFGYRDIGFDTAFPYGIGIIATYSLLQLIVLRVSTHRARDRA